MQPNLPEAERRIEEARRTQAESLDLGDLALRELPAGIGGLLRLRALYLGKMKPAEVGKFEWDGARDPIDLTDLSLLSALPGLQSLNLYGCEGLTDVSSLEGLQGLQSLDLSGTGITDLSALAGLQGLQSLSLSSTGVADLSVLAGLQGLQGLLLSETGITDLSSLKVLKGLKALDLSSTGVTDLSPLAGLQGLQILLLSSTGVTDLSALAGLQGLQILSLSSTKITDLSVLAGLQGLQSLYLSETGVTDLSPLAGLQGLQSLYLLETGVTDLSPLAGLQGLQDLYLSSTKITDLSVLAGLQGLQSLYLSGTGVTDLSPLAGLQGLQSLYLLGTGVPDLSPLAGLQGLRSLNLYRCRPAPLARFLRTFMDHPCLTELTVDEAVGVPHEILSRRPNDNCLPHLRTYFSELDLGSEPENEVKVILLGNGCVGKTQLCRRFRGQPFDESVPSTHGVQIWREDLRIHAGAQEQTFQVNWWDFGGQDIYHGTHALFLRSRAVFLILWTPSLENRDEYSENGIPLGNQPLAYWLDYVRSLAGKGSPVIVVQSQCDRFADRRPDPQRPDGFGFFECCAYSAKEGLGREVLEGQLHNAIRYLLERNGALEIGHGRAEVRRQLYDWRSEDQEREPNERQHRTLALDDFQALCDGTKGILSWEHALDYFHQTGVVFYQPDLFSNRIILDQDWALDAVYAVFHRSRAVPWLRDSGRFTREDLAITVWQEHSLEEQTLFLGLMESCGVCFSCGETSQGETRFVAPDLLPRFEAVADRVHLVWTETPNTPILRLEYRFFHPAIIRSLMSAVGQKAENFGEYWKYGLWVKDGRWDSQLLVQFEDTSTDKAPGAGALVLKAQGRDPLSLLREIRKTIRWRRIGGKPEELLTLDGTTVARSALATVAEGRVLDVEKRLVAAAEFIAFFEEREYDQGKVGAIAIDITPRPLTEWEKPREVFISYAWGDETPAGKIRTQVVDGLYSALEKDGFKPFRDRDQIRPGERISPFIRQLTRADLVVAIISEKYMRSTYCMYEIYRLWQRCQGDSEELAKCLVSIVLPEVKIGGLEERASYQRYWVEQARKLEALLHDPDLSLSGESVKEVRLVREFAWHVDEILLFLQDALMSRDLESHLDDDFQAVREALRRRMEGSAASGVGGDFGGPPTWR